MPSWLLLDLLLDLLLGLRLGPLLRIAAVVSAAAAAAAATAAARGGSLLATPKRSSARLCHRRIRTGGGVDIASSPERVVLPRHVEVVITVR